MRRGITIGFACLLGFDVLAQLGFKLAGDAALPVEADIGWLLRLLSQPGTYMAIIGYLGAFLTWMSLLKHAPIGPAFAASHLEVVVVMPFAVMLFGETVHGPQLLGAVAIVAGILCLAMEGNPGSPTA
ncbi:EamA family transporter [Niveispirillum sp.]|uniref:EamA family transporter n=1 Tax=Niveispirillum sp. TaxID=1917217 RepID=UPI001B4799EC|nr:EamA family transporter [Niveispirillum sp.]MBP7337714.1 EamA family transporter [Niveispirillum sp.]